MHILDSTDNAGGLFTPGPPRTLIGSHYLNAVGREIIDAILAANITLRASGSADATAGYGGQLLQAIRELSFRSEFQNYTVTATFDALMTEPTNPNTTIRLVAGGTDYPDQTISMSDVIGNSKKLRVIINATPTRKFISVVDGVVPIMPGYAVSFIALNYTVTTTDDSMKWIPLDSKILRPISMRCLDVAGTVTDSGVVYGFWWADGGLAYLQIPVIDVRVSGVAQSLDYEGRMFLAIADGAFPFFEYGNFAFPYDSFSFLVHANAGNGDVLMSGYYSEDGGPSGYSRRFGLRPFPAVTAVAIHRLSAQVFQIPIFDNPIP